MGNYLDICDIEHKTYPLPSATGRIPLHCQDHQDNRLTNDNTDIKGFFNHIVNRKSLQGSKASKKTKLIHSCVQKNQPNSAAFAADGLYSSAKERPRINLKNAAFLPANLKQLITMQFSA